MDVTLKLLKAISYLDNRQLLAAHMPQGRVWEQVFNQNSNLGKIVGALAVEYYRLGLLVEETAAEVDIDATNKLLLEWEKSVGIPGICFDGTGDIATRRQNIKMLFTNFGGVQTIDDFRRIAEFYGLNVDIQTGVYHGGFPMQFPLMSFSSSKSAKFTVVIIVKSLSGDAYFPLPFPLPFSSGGTTFLKCIFDILVPANVHVIAISYYNL